MPSMRKKQTVEYDEMLSGQLTLLPGLQPRGHCHKSRHKPNRPQTQQPKGRLPALPGCAGCHGQVQMPQADHVHHRDPAWLTSAGMYLNLLTSPLVNSQPLLQAHLSLSQLGAQPFPAAQQPPHGTPNNQPTSTELPAPIGPEYEPIGELTYQMLQFAAETCPSWSAEELYQRASMTRGANDPSRCIELRKGLSNLQLAGHGLSHSNSQQSVSHSPLLAPSHYLGSVNSNSHLLTPSNSLGLMISHRHHSVNNSHQSPNNTPLLLPPVDFQHQHGLADQQLSQRMAHVRLVGPWQAPPGLCYQPIDRLEYQLLELAVSGTPDIHQP